MYSASSEILTQVRETIFIYLLLIIHFILHARSNVWKNRPKTSTIYKSCLGTSRQERVDMHLHIGITRYISYCMIHNHKSLLEAGLCRYP